jgi:myo-inositol 2-dehydrogenase / D-chiro-inositol 1-dehydrogenase
MVGEIVACETHYLAGQLWHRGRKPDWSEMEYQCRNWLYFDWLSGDFNTEQHVHSLDKIAWVLGDRYPIRATAMGGRSQRTGAEYGNVYDHFSTVYEYEGGLNVYSSCRQMNDTTSGVWDNVMGTKGTATLNGNAHHPEQRIVDRSGKVIWRYAGRNTDMYQVEHDEFFASIRAGKPINNGSYMTRSTFMAILARESAYTGRTLSWDELWNGNLDHTPPAYAWGQAPQRPIAVPGVYKLPK